MHLTHQQLKNIFVFVFALCITTAYAQQPTIKYLLPDAGAPGMCVQIDFIASADSVFAFGQDGVFPTSTQVLLMNPDDSARVRFGPLVIRYNGRLVHTMVFINPNAAAGPVPVRIRRGGTVGNVDTFFIVAPQHIGLLNAGYATIGDGTAGHGKRSKRGTIVADSIILTYGTYGFSSSDLDGAPGNQGYLPLTILLQGKFSLDNNSNLHADGNDSDGAPGGSGGQGNIVLTSCPTPPSVSVPGNGFAGGSTAGAGAPGVGSAAGGASLSGVKANTSGGPASLFDGATLGGGGGMGTIDTGHIAGGGGGGANATVGGNANSGTTTNASSSIGSPDIVPLNGGGGGGTGNAFGKLCPVSGRGGGGGGAVLVFADSGIDLQGDVTANGGAGSAAQCTADSANAGGGGGGGGGSFLFASAAGISNTGRISAVGGNSGAPCGTGFGGGQGGDGKIRIDGVLTGNGSITPTVHFHGPVILASTFTQSKLDTIIGTGNTGDSIIVWLMNNDDGIRRAIGPFTAVVNAQKMFAMYVPKDSLLKATADSIVTVVSTQHATDLYTLTPTYVLGQASAMIINLPHGLLTPSDTSIDFGTLQLGTPATKQLSFINTGTRPLTITSIQAMGAGQQIFSATQPTLPHTVAVGGTLTIHLECTLSDTGKIIDSIAVIASDPGATAMFIHGAATCAAADLPVLSIDTSYSFGIEYTNNYRTRHIHVTNTGDIPATISKIIFSGGDSTSFFTSSLPPLTISAGDSTTISLSFAPKHAGSNSTTCVLTTDDVLGIHKVQLTGTGSATPLIYPDKICVPQTITGDTLLTICNAEDSALSVTNVSVYMTNVGFTVKAFDKIIPEGGCATVSVHYEDAGTAKLTLSCAGLDDIVIPITSDCNTAVRTTAQLPQSPLEIFPNPCIACNRIQITSGANGDPSVTRMELLDVFGRVVREFSNQEFKSGVMLVEVSEDHLAAGLYFMRLAGPRQTSVVPFAVVN